MYVWIFLFKFLFCFVILSSCNLFLYVLWQSTFHWLRCLFTSPSNSSFRLCFDHSNLPWGLILQLYVIYKCHIGYRVRKIQSWRLLLNNTHIIQIKGYLLKGFNYYLSPEDHFPENAISSLWDHMNDPSIYTIWFPQAQNMMLRAGKLALWFRVLVALSWNLGSLPSIHMVAHMHPVTTAQRNLTKHKLFWTIEK